MDGSLTLMGAMKLTWKTLQYRKQSNNNIAFLVKGCSCKKVAGLNSVAVEKNSTLNTVGLDVSVVAVSMFQFSSQWNSQKSRRMTMKNLVYSTHESSCRVGL